MPGLSKIVVPQMAILQSNDGGLPNVFCEAITILDILHMNVFQISSWVFISLNWKFMEIMSFIEFFVPYNLAPRFESWNRWTSFVWRWLFVHCCFPCVLFCLNRLKPMVNILEIWPDSENTVVGVAGRAKKLVEISKSQKPHVKMVSNFHLTEERVNFIKVFMTLKVTSKQPWCHTSKLKSWKIIVLSWVVVRAGRSREFQWFGNITSRYDPRFHFSMMVKVNYIPQKLTLRTWQAKTQKETHLKQPQCFRC